MVLKRSGIMRTAARSVVQQLVKTNCFLWIVFAGCLCRVLLKQLFAQYLEELRATTGEAEMN
jgi:hypothetical protein